ncbi:hypothetical protein QTO34_007569 [Cnephaeus nilssonii]|uniref:Reverse transcriptase/retrotransposon-derived protein RNase H-like domain-containing protein n=1 Tax=Cnephaeus nilssonii TaxID=3371016 RepID=A0AA40HIK8_CNENI|nr:hypothetical protein QTO34_007569 [Eptesicus nilssonii]
MPECPYPLLVRDLLQKLLGSDLLQKIQATISFEGDGAHLTMDPRNPEEHLLQEMEKVVPGEEYKASTYLEELQHLYPMVWAENNPPGLASHQAPVVVQLQATTTPAWPLNWTEVEQRAFEELKKALNSAPALALPDITKPFHLYMSEVRGIAKGVLTQTLGPWKRPVAYLSKRLDPVVAGWPACLRAVVASAMLVKEADKLTLGQKLALTTPHAVEALLRDQPRIQFHKTLAINPASLLPDDDPEEPIHDCTEVTDAVQTAHPDLSDVPLSSPDEVLFTDGSSYIQDGIRYAGAAVVTLDHTIWAQSLNRGTPFDGDTVPSTGKEGYQLQPERTFKNKQEILALLEVIWLPRAVAIVHCKGHQKGETIEARGNRATDQTAKEAAQKPVGPLQVLVSLPDPDLPQTPSYTKQEEELAEQKQAIKGPDDDRLLVPEALGRTLVAQLHQATHLGVTKTSELLRGRYYIPS